MPIEPSGNYVVLHRKKKKKKGEWPQDLVEDQFVVPAF